MSYPQFGYPYSSAPQVSFPRKLFSVHLMCFVLLFVMGFIFLMLQRLILSSILLIFPFTRFWPRTREAVTVLFSSVEEGVALQPVIPVFLQRRRQG